MKMPNIYQADVFIKEGCQVIGCGVGKNAFVYIEFNENDEKFIETMARWRNREFIDKE